MRLKCISVLLSICLLFSASGTVLALDGQKLNPLITLALDAGKPTIVAGLPYFCSDMGLDMMTRSLETYMSGGDAGLFHGVFDMATQYADAETLGKCLESLKLVDASVRESFQRTCQNNTELSLTEEEQKGAELLLEKAVKLNSRLQEVLIEFDITPGVFASYLSGAALLGEGASLLQYDGTEFTLHAYDAEMVKDINAIWQPGSNFDLKTYMESAVSLLNSYLSAEEKKEVLPLFYRTGILAKDGTVGHIPTIQAPQNTVKTPFTDIENEWGRPYIEALYAQGVINGVTDTLFMPKGNITREAFVKLIVTLFGLQATTEELPFADADSGAWYYPYVAAAYEHGIIKGVSEDAFGVGANIKRQDMAVILDRILQSRGITGTPLDISYFKDYATISGYAQQSVLRIAGLGIISGDDLGQFNPEQFATRQEAAKMIYGLQAVAIK